jgi:hypothetical protein
MVACHRRVFAAGHRPRKALSDSRDDDCEIHGPLVAGRCLQENSSNSVRGLPLDGTVLGSARSCIPSGRRKQPLSTRSVLIRDPRPRCGIPVFQDNVMSSTYRYEWICGPEDAIQLEDGSIARSLPRATGAVIRGRLQWANSQEVATTRYAVRRSIHITSARRNDRARFEFAAISANWRSNGWNRHQYVSSVIPLLRASWLRRRPGSYRARALRRKSNDWRRLDGGT